jgi:hypothetical protein
MEWAACRGGPPVLYLKESMHLTPIRVALLGLLSIVVFQWFLVQGHGGNWTMLFCAGDQVTPPPDVAPQMYRFANSWGFDGQYYYYIARDFTDARGTSAYIDNASMRWLRALVPGLASALAFGNPEWVLATYIGVMWGLAALGLWISGKLAEHWGYPAAVGFAFLLIPAVLVSLERMMTDISLVVLLLALLLALARQNTPVIYFTLMLVPLARETGIAITAGWVLWSLWKREWKPALYGAATALPFLVWFVYQAQRHPGAIGFWSNGAPFSGILQRLMTPVIYPTDGLGFKLAAVTDYLGAWGIAAAFAIAVLLLVRGERSLLVFAAVVYTLGISLFTKEDMWGEAYSYSRTGGPVAVMLALLGVEQRRWWLVVPMLLALPRIALQLGVVAWVAVKGLL